MSTATKTKTSVTTTTLVGAALVVGFAAAAAVGYSLLSNSQQNPITSINTTQLTNYHTLSFTPLVLPPATTIKQGINDAHLYDFSLTAKTKDVEIDNLHLVFYGKAPNNPNGGYICSPSDNSYCYLSNFRIIDDQGNSVMNNILKGQGTITIQGLNFIGKITLKAGETKHFTLIAASFNGELHSGEYLNKQYMAEWEPLAKGDVVFSDNRSVVTDIYPNIASQGNYLTVK